MLPTAARLSSADDHRLVARRGRRVRRGPLVVTYLRPPRAVSGTPGGPLATVVAPKRVGTAVRRNRVQRQLRHLLAALLPALPAGSRMVVRAEPGSTGLTSAELAEHLGQALVTLGLVDVPVTAEVQ